MTKKLEKQIRSLRKQGMSIKGIAKELHISDKTISKILKPVPASNKIEVAKPTDKKKVKPINLYWKNGMIAGSDMSPAKILILAHEMMAYAITELAK